MAHFSTTFKIQKSINHTFHSFLDESLMQHWVSGFQDIEIIKGEPRKEDSLYRMLINFDGEDLKIYQKIIEIEHCKRVLVQMEHPELFTYTDLVFSETGAHTELQCKVKIVGKNLKVKLAMPIVKNMLHKRNQQDYSKFKKVVEGRICKSIN